MKANVNRETCIGCGRCVSISPEVFQMRQGKSQVRQDADYAETRWVKSAERQCPSNSIKVHE